MRNKMILALAAAGTMLVAATPAMARDGCGRGFHRGWHDRCVPNRGPGYYAGGPNVRLVIGNYYPNRGYWDGRRYWQHRERWRGGWRYR
jgi:hypothetical protein